MKPSNFSTNAFNSGPLLRKPAVADESSPHVFSDSEWMAMRHQQMDIAPNCIFPRREQKSLAQYLHLLRAFVAAAIRLPIRM